MKIELIGCERGDWEVLKVNGEKFAEGHKINKWNWIDFIKKYFDEDINVSEISNKDMEEGNY